MEWNYYPNKVLREIGIGTGSLASYYGSSALEQSPIIAYCSSLTCESSNRPKNKFGIKKEVDGKPDSCPDCGNYLFYK